MHKILIIRFTSLGDLVTLEPIFRMIREFYPNSEISFLTTEMGRGLYSDTKYFDKYFIRKTYLNTIKELRKSRFNLLINLQCNKPSHYISLFVRKDRVVNKSFNLFQKIFGIKVKSKLAKELLISLCENTKVANTFLKEFDNDILMPKSTRNFLNKDNSKKYIAISTGTSERWLSKRWGIKNYFNLIKLLLEKNYVLVLIGTSLEVEDSKNILSSFPSVLNYVNKTSLTELKILLSEVDLYIGNDSGPSHIAASTGTSTITIFGSTDKKHCVKFMPYKGIHKYLTPINVSCHPCYKSICPLNMECMESIKVVDVYNKVLEIFSKEK